jgi:hypothetical protein
MTSRISARPFAVLNRQINIGIIHRSASQHGAEKRIFHTPSFQGKLKKVKGAPRSLMEHESYNSQDSEMSRIKGVKKYFIFLIPGLPL